MAFTWQFEAKGCIVIHITDQVVFQDIIDFLEQIRIETSKHPVIYELIRCSEDLHVELSSEAAQIVANALKENLSHHRNGAIAFVCATDHIYGLCRQLGMRVETDAMPVEVFRTEAEAREWFRQVRAMDSA